MIQNVADIFMTLVCCFGYISVMNMFCKRYLDITPANAKLFAGFLFADSVLTNVLDQCGLIPGIAVSVLNHLLFIGWIILLFRGGTEKKIFTASMLIAVITLTENFFVAFFSCLALVFLHIIKGIPASVLSAGECRLIAYISCGLVISAVYWLANHSASVFACKTGKWYGMSALSLLAATAVVDAANWGASKGILLRSGGNMGLYCDQIFSHAGFCIVTVLCASAAGFYVFGTNQIYLEQKKSDQYHLQIAAYKMLEEQYGQQERLRHDLKNHMIALSGLLKNKEWEKMENYLKEMESGAGLETSEEITGNRVVDVLMNQKRKIAERKSFVWECDVQIPKVCGINEFDLCVLFGNILDNAVEACERMQNNGFTSSLQPFIKIQSGMVKKCFLLEVKNSVDMSDEHKTGFRDKEKNVRHGIGLLNVSDVVHKYNGTMKIETQSGVFVISILIPLRNAECDMKQVI